MLILTRRPGQSIWIGNNIEVVIQEIRGNQVKLGISAPKSVSVDREEIAMLKIQRQINRNK